MREAEGVPLPSGRMTSGLVRHGDRVRRPTGPWSPAVHEYLRHLDSAGFEGSPRVLATGDGWEELTYIEGEVAFDPDWQPGRGNRLPPQARTCRALAGVGRLQRAARGRRRSGCLAGVPGRRAALDPRHLRGPRPRPVRRG